MKEDTLKSNLDSDWRRIIAMKVSTEYDSEEHIVMNKISARMLNGLAKLKASFRREPTGGFRSPLIGLATKHLSVLYDHEDRNALVTLSANLGQYLQLSYLRDVQAQQGEVKLIATSEDSKYKAELACDDTPSLLPRATFIFPNGELKIEDEIREEKRAFSVSGFVGGTVMNGVLLADYRDETATLKYKFKDEELTLVPSLTWPSGSLSLAFKRQFNEQNKLSYCYNFQSETWSAVYKHKPSENFKVKLGYDSEVGVSWASAWIGKEEAGAKTAPRKCKLQVMFQVPQNDLNLAVLLFRIKKRWDL